MKYSDWMNDLPLRLQNWNRTVVEKDLVQRASINNILLIKSRLLIDKLKSIASKAAKLNICIKEYSKCYYERR